MTRLFIRKRHRGSPDGRMDGYRQTNGVEPTCAYGKTQQQLSALIEALPSNVCTTITFRENSSYVSLAVRYEQETLPPFQASVWPARHRHHHPKSPQTLFKGSRVVYNLQRQQHSRVHLTGLQNPYRAMHEVLFFVEYPTVSSHLLPYIC